MNTESESAEPSDGTATIPIRKPRAGAVPEPPASLTPDGAAEWRRLAKRLTKSGVLTPETIGLFATYCESYSTWQEAQRHPATQTTISKNGTEWSAPSAWFVVGTRAFAAMARSAAALGLTAAGVQRRKKKSGSRSKLRALLMPRD